MKQISTGIVAIASLLSMGAFAADLAPRTYTKAPVMVDIAMKLKKMGSHRPSTHDLINSILKTLQSQVVKIVVNDLKENTYYALIYLNRGGEEIIIDSRPSDAMAIALAVDAPIFVSEQVIEKARTIDMEKEGDQLKEWLESLNPDDFKFKA